MGASEAGVTPWFVFVALFAGAVETHAQKLDSLPDPELVQDGGLVEHPRLEFLPGLRLMAGSSPGGSIDLTWNTPGRLPALSVQLFAFGTRWESRLFADEEHRDLYLMARIKASMGKGDGGSLFVFLDRGRRRFTEGPNTGQIHSVSGFGVGAGLAGGRLGAAFELGLGQVHAPDVPQYLQVGVHFQVRLLRF